MRMEVKRSMMKYNKMNKELGLYSIRPSSMCSGPEPFSGFQTLKFILSWEPVASLYSWTLNMLRSLCKFPHRGFNKMSSSFFSFKTLTRQQRNKLFIEKIVGFGFSVKLLLRQPSCHAS